MADRARAISVAQLSTAAHRAAEEALREHKALQGQRPDPGIIVRPPWIMGIIFRNADPQHLVAFQHLAGHVAEQVQKDVAAGGIAGAEVHDSAVYCHDHIVICGFLPPAEGHFTLE